MRLTQPVNWSWELKGNEAVAQTEKSDRPLRYSNSYGYQVVSVGVHSVQAHVTLCARKPSGLLLFLLPSVKCLERVCSSLLPLRANNEPSERCIGENRRLLRCGFYRVQCNLSS